MEETTSRFDVIVVGAGPAGLSAARVVAEHGLSVTIIDEFPLPGGRMNGQFHEEPDTGLWVGKEVAAKLVSETTELGVVFRCGQAVHDIVRTATGWSVKLTGENVQGTFLLLATGAAEIPTPLPGWTLPGVMSVGAAQVMTNVHYVKPGKRGIVIGVNVLAMAIASELIASEVELVSIVLPAKSPFTKEAANPAAVFQTLIGLSHMAPSALLRIGGKWAKRLRLSRVATRFLPKRGIKMWGVPLQLRTAALQINGIDKVESVTLADVNRAGELIPGSERDVDVDFVAIAGGLYPMAELASVIGCPFTYIPALGGHIPVHDEQLRTPVDKLYVAGNITGIESAKVAMAQGRLAGASICQDAGLCDEVSAAMQDVVRTRAKSLIQFAPGIAEARESLYHVR
ncbi:NAD(P)/FAD-dependent oxidoreductase [Alicyclobacillus fastidiosus]|uniref:NAD(P)/FAD-dependent oxidoreductase n=1 Tax=Alicyclobacillus fastidiosus TaxID=392011 RepID=A0ABY6ZCB1_9BACL|nr:FAD-dependent oxidoreductase [Alicyclobacillus fastidiosus]WAH40497.1 NAD(P)/FAD-dependent oxidoreductase [Alicyclobacillus fastidiosus]GMA61913.1 sarcosine oxidase subunit alpha [Alicyclobacillus fastidiosus]